MRRLLPIGFLFISIIVHLISLRKPLDTLLLGLLGIVPLFFIYFGDELGANVSGKITEPTPGIFVKAFGWLWLACVIFPLLYGAPFNPRRY